jgi:hypothetical protein
MPQGRNALNYDRPSEGRDRRARRLIAGLRVTRQDEALLAMVRPFFPDAASESELAYRLWRRGLEVTLGELVGLGAALPPGASEELIAGLVAQRLLLCVPLLRRTGTLALLGLELESVQNRLANPEVAIASLVGGSIDDSASAAVGGMGGTDFL